MTIGLVGRGIGASLSPIMHEHEGRRLGLDYRYHLIDFDRMALGDDRLIDMVAEAQELGFAGLNVTYPFKQAIIPLLSSLDRDAEAIGAVNTVVFSGGQSIGYNTDCSGFAESFEHDLAEVSRRHVLQLGAGGAGAAVSRALVQCGVKRLDIYDTDASKSAALAARLSRSTETDVRAVADPALATEADGIVNTTPIGMAKHPGLPMDAALVHPGQWVADVVYFPLETELLRLARGRGCRVLSGSGMAVFQAARAFELFTGLEPDAKFMAATFRNAIETKSDR